jgi:DNA-binding LacI/PurR family transcriptional regulator
MSVTLADIAKYAGVSRPAVSLVLNDRETRHVSKEKKERILRALDELNYLPNYAARQLRGASTKTIGIVGGLFGVPVHAAITDAVMRELRDVGYQVLLGDCSQGNEIVKEFEARGVDGFIFTSGVSEKVIRAIKKPVLRVTHNLEEYDIAVDMEYGGYIAGKHLLEHGHSRVGFISSDKRSGVFRLAGLKRAMAEKGLIFDDKWTIFANSDKAFAKTKTLVKKQKVTAFFTLNDFFASSLVCAMLDSGINVPEDVAVVGFDGLPFVRLMRPSITTVVQPVCELARLSAEMLLKRINGENYDQEPLLLKPHLEPGMSCGCEAREITQISVRGIIPTLDYNYKEFGVE